ncbi:MAG: inositol-3-phosphate synthase [Candidatus Heimdallarchaeota archaeon]|nr:MAG: inositol-3-phosphate synthase [Candidatus Heimdallarchaeota archaeon]
MGKIRVAIAGLGNCASALIQGVHYYRNEKEDSRVPGLMHVQFGEYHVNSLEFVAAFEVNRDKIGKRISDAIWVSPNCTPKFSEVPPTEGIVYPGPIFDGVPPHMMKPFHCYDEAKMKAVNVAEVLEETKTEILVNFLPVGSEKATRVYAEACLEAGVSLANGIPTFIVSDPTKEWPQKFENAGIPCAGDDIKSQVGATILHRVLAKLMLDRGVEIEKTYQLNVGGNTDFENMKYESRLKTKRISKTEAVTSLLPHDVPTRIGPSDYVPFLEDRKICYLLLQGKKFGDQPLSIEVKLSVIDSPNSAGVMIDVIRALKIGKDRNVAGPLTSISSYAFKHPPVQIPDFEAHEKVEAFIRGEIDR